MKDNQGHKRATGRDVQRNLFLGSLRSQLTHLDDIHSNLMKSASEYLDQGMDYRETQELLILDGHNTEVVKACIAKLAESPSDEISEEGKKYGFNAEDGAGRTFSHADLGIVITASSENEAWEKAEEIVANSTAGCLERVVDIFEI